MAKYIVDLQEIYEDKSDIDEYLISTDTRAITNTFTRQPTVKNDTRVALSPSEKMNVSMEKIDRYLQQLKEVAFYNPLATINATISSEENQVFTAKVVKSFYDSYTIQMGKLNAFANMYKYNFNAGTLINPLSDAMLKTNTKATALEWLKLSEAIVGTANNLTVYDANSNAATTLKAYTKDDTSTPEYLYGSLSGSLYNVKPFKSGNVKVGEATLSNTTNELRIYNYNGSLSSSGAVKAKQIIDSTSAYVEFTNNLGKILVINSARQACTINSGGTLVGDPITLTWKGELNTPKYVFGGPDRNNVHVYSPENFSVKHAETAGSADNATNAGSAENAEYAKTAGSAGTADYAKTAGSATSADTANSAGTAISAGSATTAESANKVWTQSHNGSWYINSNYSNNTEEYFVTDAKCTDGSVKPIWVGKATTAVTAARATAADKAAQADLANAVAWSNVTNKPMNIGTKMKIVTASGKFGGAPGLLQNSQVVIGLNDIDAPIGTTIHYSLIMVLNIAIHDELSINQNLKNSHMGNDIFNGTPIFYDGDAYYKQVVNVYSGNYNKTQTENDIMYYASIKDFFGTYGGNIGDISVKILLFYNY